MTAITASPVTVDFHGTAIPTFNVEGIVRVAMKPICQSIGLEWHGQRQRINRHPVLSKGAVMITAPSKGGIQRLLTLPLNKLNGWLFGIDTNRVKPEIRKRLVAYQAECFDVLADYWQKGEAVNPRATTIAERRPLNRAVRTLANLRSVRGQSADYAGMWKLVNGYLGIEHIDEATQEQVERAMAFVQEGIERETSRIVEGEWLGRDAAPAPAAITLDYPLTRQWNEWQEHQLIGGDAMYHSDLRRLVQQLLEASRTGSMVQVGRVDNIQSELKALANLCEVQGIQKRAAQSRLARVENFVGSLAKTTQCMQSAVSGR